MKSMASLVALLAALTYVNAESGTGQPGYCKDDKSCKNKYVCISVQTTRSGTEDVKQCLPYKKEGDVCSGTFSGLCPSFSTWKTAFQSISSVCAYQLPSGTDKCLNSSVTGSTAGYVSCMDIKEGSSPKAKDVGVIFGCVDFDGTNLLFDKKSDNWAMSAKMNYTGVINGGCVNPKNTKDSDVVCSGRGTCAPKSPSSMDYACECNVGYNGTFCQTVVSNKCTLESQCQAGTCNLDTQECECNPGTTGNQCAFCDPTSPKACNGKGTCIAATKSSSGSGSDTGSMSSMPSVGTVKSASSSTSDTSAGDPSQVASSNKTESTSKSDSTTKTDSKSDNKSKTTKTTKVDTSDNSQSRFLMEAVGMASSDGQGEGNVCKCEAGWSGDQCTRKVDTGGSGKGTKKNNGGTTSDATSVATSIALVMSSIVVALLN